MNQASPSKEAVVFFDNDGVGKQMLLAEFDAVLDGVVPLYEFAGEDRRAAFVRLDGALRVTAVVFFRIRFDAQGYPEHGWNVPLYRLADGADRGPDLGAGPIRLAHRSSCPILGLEDDLWEPELGLVGNALELLQATLRDNRLGLVAEDAPAPVHATVAPAWQAQAHGAVPAAVSSPGSDAAVQAVVQQYSQQLSALREQHSKDVQQYAERLKKLEQHASVLYNDKQELLTQLEEAGAAVDDAASRAAAQVAELRQNAQQREAVLLADLERREQQLVADAERQLQEQRDAAAQREAELLEEREQAIVEAVAERTREIEEGLAEQERRRDQQEEQLNSLRAELTELRRSKLRLLEDGADDFLARLRDMGIKFVAFHPGAGHINIALEDMVEYLRDTESFVARRCGVSVEHYRAWLAHYEKPTCQGHASREALCGKPVQKCLRPGEFVVGIHDRCDIHRRGELPAGASGA
jgi:hypothetical protein